ncbi:MAG TPA: hypothetical protein VKV04_05425, partial [Verrucomicrobiae bacterium]|nr:hypothetical protein [Verrucomicrobiae bacterium]
MRWVFMESLQSELESRSLALALIQVVKMWSQHRYGSFLNAGPGEITKDWFNWFVGEWKVARNITDGYKPQVREYLNRHFRRAASACEDGGSVDTAAHYIKQRGWSSGLPTSLVSKIGFFLRPERFVPLDSFSVKGLNQLLKTSGAAKVNRKPYRPYLDAFDRMYAHFEPQLKAALHEPWVIGMADQLGCPRTAVSSSAMRRKLFDDYLMHSAEYRA